MPSLTVSGVGFALSGAPTIPATIQPGGSISFQIVFSGTTTGTYSGILAVGTRQFSLTGKSISSPLPAPSFQLDEQPLTSQHQVHLTVQLASASSVSAIGTLTMQFAPSVSNVTDDPAVVFTATNGRQLQVAVASGAQNATYNGQTGITFQTGTTAGTLTFTVSFPNAAPFAQAFTIVPAQIQITASQAQRQSPNLVVTLTGYDNTYSAGQLSFTFYGTNGQILASNMQVDATSSFHQYFFTNDQAGGAFSLQASFPVNGDVTQVGSVAINLTNAVGQTSVNQTFQ